MATTPASNPISGRAARRAAIGALLFGAASAAHPAAATVLTTDGSAQVRSGTDPRLGVNFAYSTPDAAQVAGPPAGQVLRESERTANGATRLVGYATEDGLIGAYAAAQGSAVSNVDTKIHTTVTAAADGRLIGTFHFDPFQLVLHPTSSIPGTASASIQFSISGNGTSASAFVGLIEDSNAVPQPQAFVSGIDQSALNLTTSSSGGTYQASGDLGTITLDFGIFAAGQSLDLDYEMMAGARAFEDASTGTGGIEACGLDAGPSGGGCFPTPIAIASISDPFAFANSTDASGFLAGERARFGGPGISFSVVPVSVPEPASLALLGVGLIGFGLTQRTSSSGARRKRA